MSEQIAAKRGVRARNLRLSDTGKRGDEIEHTFAKMTGFGTQKRIRLYQRLFRFTSSNISIGKALEMIWARYNRGKDTRRTVFRRMIESVVAGRSVSEAMSDYVPAAERLLIFAGEESNRIAAGFKQAIFVAEAVRSMKKALWESLRYPAVLFIILAAILYGVATQFVPTMLQLAPLSQWPTLALVVYYIGTGVQNFGLWILIGLVVGTIVIVRTLTQWTGPVRDRCDRWLPPWTIFRQYTSAIFLISLSALTDAGRPVETAIKQLSQISGPWMRRHLNEMHRRVLEGEDPGRAFNTGLLDQETCGDLEDYSSAGNLDTALAQIGKDTVEDSVIRIAASARVLDGMMKVIVALAICVIYGGMMSLVFKVAQNAQR